MNKNSAEVSQLPAVDRVLKQVFDLSEEGMTLIVEAALSPLRALIFRSTVKKREKMLLTVENAFRRLPLRVIGTICDDAYPLDLRCLEVKNEVGFVAQLNASKR